MRTRTSAILWCFFLGVFGAHKFYLGQSGWGIVYLLFFWTGIPSIAAFIEFIMLLLMADNEFNRRFNSGANQATASVIPNHKREATDRASSIESLPTREAMTDLVISERRFLTKSLNSSIFLGKVNRKPCFKCNQTRSIGFNSGE